jgi:hypothetical protein
LLVKGEAISIRDYFAAKGASGNDAALYGVQGNLAVQEEMGECVNPTNPTNPKNL